ncbi:MAG: 8-hydroxy-5-deazaflavin:NADPH oxidoreductase [Archaeoglobi archaeon]|nr:8-hydroxy-5-deazaflavin:NADPH oxidoreductase [Archaeoglobi archaeon]
MSCKIAILGGTGDIGEGLALRWAIAGHEIIIGSRREEKAKDAVERYLKILKERGYTDVKMKGMENKEAAAQAEIIVLSIPYEHTLSTLEHIRDVLKDQIIICPVVPMEKRKGYFIYTPPEEGSAAEMVQKAVPETCKVVAAYQNIAADKLANLDLEIDYDVVVCGPKEERKKVMELTEQMGKLRALDGGPLPAARMVEAMTPLIINVAMKNKMKDVSIKFVE